MEDTEPGAMTKRIWDFARMQFRDRLQWILDDPGNMIAADIAELRDVAGDLKIDFDKLVNEVGTDYEIKRLREIEAGMKD